MFFITFPLQDLWDHEYLQSFATSMTAITSPTSTGDTTASFTTNTGRRKTRFRSLLSTLAFSEGFELLETIVNAWVRSLLVAIIAVGEEDTLCQGQGRKGDDEQEGLLLPADPESEKAQG